MENDISLLITLPVLIVGLTALVWSADKFVEGGASIAHHCGVSSLIIGLTVISIGTSAPEIFVSANAALDQSSGLAVGNALGSNLANVGLVLGITALITPVAITRGIVKTEVPIMLGVTLLAGYVLHDAHLGRWESLALLACLVLFIFFLIAKSRNGSADEGAEGGVALAELSLKKAIVVTIVGLVILILSSKALVWSATEMAQKFGVSDLVIGITIVAVGTSLPELAASLAGALKGHSEMAVGNVIGSNIFNLLAVLPVAGVIYPTVIDDVDFLRDYGSVLLVSMILGAACLWKTRNSATGVLGRPLALILLTTYVGYYCWLLL